MLPNRLLFQERLRQSILQARRAGSMVALLYLDLDRFKVINDTLGHASGDAVLTRVAARLRSSLRESDTLARMSGDEFTVIAPGLKNPQHASLVAETVLKALRDPFEIEGQEFYVTASVGISIYPRDAMDAETLQRNADNAMYRAKNGTKCNAIYFDVNMGRTITARMELEQRLRLAIRDRKFCCAFQPKVDIRTQDVIGFETLVRWRDDDGEIQPPSSFVGLAVELGLIDPITQFVMTEALRSIEQLDDSFGSDTAISVNVAAKQAGDIEFMRSLVSLLKDSPHAKRVMIELTEDAFLEKGKFQAQVLPMLREIGVRVSIDDFGTGYSSLSALAEIPADELKVDRSFITSIHERPRSQSVLRAIESLGHALEMTIVAEGVETFEELAYLQAATRIRYAQGYYFSKPFFLTDAANVKRVNFEGRAAEATREHVGRRGVGGSRGG
jgi:c-di-GMP phosphodiesterase Gmr